MKVLIVRFSSIGDIVLTTPVVSAIYEQIPNVEIHYITKKSFASLLTENPKISKFYTIEKSISEVLTELKKEEYDFVIDLHKNIRTLQLKQKLGVKNYSFDKLNFKKWLLVNFKVNKLPKIHIVDRYFEAVKSLGVENRNQQCELLFDSQHTVDVQMTFNLEIKSYLTVAVGAQFATKTMPTPLLVSILSKISHPIILLGGPTDVTRGKEIENELKKSGKQVINAINQFSLLQSASIVAQSKTILTHDTGLMHIATAFDVPIVSVWGNTVPELGMYAYYPTKQELFSIHEVQGLNCRPCSKIGYQTCPKKHFNCMELQDTQAIINDVENRLKN